MRIYENEPLVKVNVRPRFEWDSLEPVQGVVVDGEKESAKKATIYYFIEFTAAVCVSLLGFVMIDWWVHGGFHAMTGFMHRFGPTLMRMITTGQL